MRTGLVAFGLLLAASAARAEGRQSQSQIGPVGTAQPSAGGVAFGPGDETRVNEFDKRIPGTGTGLARVPADHVPTPAPNAIALVNPGFSGFLGLGLCVAGFFAKDKMAEYAPAATITTYVMAATAFPLRS